MKKTIIIIVSIIFAYVINLEGKEFQKSDSASLISSPESSGKAQECSKGPTEHFIKAVTLLESLDFYTQAKDSIFQMIEPTNHWLYNYSKGLDSLFSGIKEIWSVYIKKSTPDIYESQKYFPDIFLEEWLFEGESGAKNFLLKLDTFRQLDKSECGKLLLKSPIIWWQESERIYVLHTRAEMFRGYLTKIEERMKDILKQNGTELKKN